METYKPMRSCDCVSKKIVGFIFAGALAYLGAMWPITDNHAASFATKFYTGLKKLTIGEALKESRKEMKSAQPDYRGWAPYSLYGDPRHSIRVENHTR
jgi:CHAT domain-containing protein